VVVDNRPGGAANIGAEAVAKSPPDGYTLLVENSNFAMTAGMYPHLSFDKATDFIPVALIGSVPVILIANPQSPVHSVAELIRLAREKPGSLAYASCGNGAPQHLAGELFKHMEHLDITHVPYKGCAPALADVVSGQIPIGFNTAANALPYIRSGRVRALAIAGATRYAQTPEVPTLIESGLPGFDVDQWFGFFAPAHTPPEVIRTLHEAINATVAIPDIRNRMNGQGFTPLSTTQAAFDKQVHEDIIRWTRFTREADIRAD
jgi:tripartite-type tricarboxylate transporter receptor subunit TctC